MALVRDGEGDRMTFARNFLKRVIARVDFTTPVSMATLPDGFRDSIRELYPISEPKKLTQLSVQGTVGPDATAPEITSQQLTEWNFRDGDRASHLQIGPEHLLAANSQHSSFDAKMGPGLDAALKAVFDNAPDLEVKRVGLRYINEIVRSDARPWDWDGWVDAAYLGPLAPFKADPSLIRSVGIVELNRDSHAIRIRYGLANRDYPAPVRSAAYLLDFDAYIEAVVDREEVMPNLKQFRDEIGALFLGAVGQSTLDYMGQTPADV